MILDIQRVHYKYDAIIETSRYNAIALTDMIYESLACASAHRQIRVGDFVCGRL